LVHRHGLTAADTVMVEDIARNLVPAARLGMATVLVRSDGRHGPPPGHPSVDQIDPGAIHHTVDALTPWLAGLARTAGSR
jgi:putative hydrolase of the HAD superfamily